ncbi:MAG: hypothetical protein MUC55_08655 [Burkholderiales bacterium]|jgi:hypothetical protein|nr:hypothetical protein [Burkholderiales bacterium]
MTMQRLIWILWPSFIVAGIAEAVFFTLFDPTELSLFGQPLEGASRMAIYSVGFFVFWLFAAGSSAFTCFLQRSSSDINQCPLPAQGRPAGCPKREEGGECS